MVSPVVLFVSFILYSYVTITVTQDIFTPPPDTKTFRRDYVYRTSTETFYRFHNVRRNFFDAVSTCHYEGAELAVPRTEEEADVLINMFPEVATKIWVGLHDIYSEGLIMTLDGIDVDNVYNEWNVGEPNDANDNEDCVQMTEDKHYADEKCTETKEFFICSKSASSVEYDALCETYYKGYFKNGNNCYKLHSHPKNWHEAYKICRAEEASLAMVNNEEEAKLLAETFKNQYPAILLPEHVNNSMVHIDLSNLFSHVEYITSDGKSPSKAGYNKWVPGQPDPGSGKDCGTLLGTGELNHVTCDTKALFFCEKNIRNVQLFRIFQRFRLDD